VNTNGKCLLPASAAPKKKKRAKDVSLCPTGETACPILGAASFEFSAKHDVTHLHTTDLVAGADGYECLDLQIQLDSCGRCGNDCSKIANTLGVGCSEGSCFVFSCQPGYDVSADGLSCLATLGGSNSTAARQRKRKAGHAHHKKSSHGHKLSSHTHSH